MSVNSKLPIKGLFIWLICAIFFTYEFLLRTVLGTFESDIIAALNITIVSFALLSTTSYQLIYGAMQLPVGFLVDRFGLKATLASAVIICSLSVFGFSISQHFNTALVMRMLMGLGSSFGFVCVLVAVYDWLPHKYIAFFIGLSQFIGTLGPMIAAGPLLSLVHELQLSWRSLFLYCSIVGLIIAGCVLIFVRNNQSSSESMIILKTPQSVVSNVLALISQPQVWLIAIYSGSTYFVIDYLSENAGISFLQLNGISATSSSFMITVAWLGFAISCPIVGIISDRIKNRTLTLIGTACIGLVSALCIFYLPLTSFWYFIAFFCLGIGTTGQSVAFAIMAEQCNNNYLAAGLGLNNAMMFFFASFFAPFIGFLLHRISHASTPQLSDYHQAFWVIIAMIVLGLIISSCFIKETFCKSTKYMTRLKQD